MERLKLYVKESYDELVNHVTWPTWANLQETTTIVLVATVVVAMLIFVMDVIAKQSTGLVYGL
jgi:preprotein translocase subunit SecE